MQQETTSHKSPPRLWTVETVCEYFGGEKPLCVSTLYRGMAAGRYPRPVNVGGARWLAYECEAALERMINERDARRRRAETRGRKRRDPQAVAS